MSTLQIVVMILGGITASALVVFALAMAAMAKDSEERANEQWRTDTAGEEQGLPEVPAEERAARAGSTNNRAA